MKGDKLCLVYTHSAFARVGGFSAQIDEVKSRVRVSYIFVAEVIRTEGS